MNWLFWLSIGLKSETPNETTINVETPAGATVAVDSLAVDSDGQKSKLTNAYTLPSRLTLTALDSKSTH